MKKIKVYKIAFFLFFVNIIYGFASPTIPIKREGDALEKVSKRIYQDAKVEKNVEVRLTNKYGKINVIAWDKDSIKLTVDIYAVAKSKDEAEKILQRVQIQPVFDEKYFILTTEIIEKQGSGAVSQLIDNILDKSKEAIDKSNVEINITLLLPETAKLILNNKYGDISFERNFKGSLQLTLAYGNVQANELPPLSTLNLQSSKAFITNFKSGRIAVKFGELNLRNVERLYLESSSSMVNIHEIKDLDMDSRNDELDITNVNSIMGKSSFSKISVQEMRQKARLEMQAGSLKVRTLRSSFEWLDIQSKSTDIRITPEENLAYQLDITGNPSEVVKGNASQSNPSNDAKNNASSLLNSLMKNGASNPLNSYSPQTTLNNTSGNRSGRVIKIHANGGQVVVR
jgi:hypothetical protein